MSNYGTQRASSVDGVKPHTLSILGLTFVVRSFEGSWKKGCCLRPVSQKTILRNISLHLQSGQLTALLGSSGSGKTTLLDAIACRASGQLVGGIFLDDKLLTESTFKQEAAYVIQTDRLLPNLTVRETLAFTAKLLFPASVDSGAIKQRVEDVINELGLRHISDTKVGGVMNKGISGGEKRRVSIAVQLLKDPNVLLLDEPTTGLDSFTAYYLMDCLSELAKKKNKIILTTIHQPRSDIFQLFDNVGILTQGEMVYMGSANQLVPHFTNQGYPCPLYANPLDHYIDICSIDKRDISSQEASNFRVSDLKMAYIHSNMFRQIVADIHDSTRTMCGVNETVRHSMLHMPERPHGFLFTFLTLFRRMMVNLYRDRSSFLVRIFQLVLLCPFVWIFLIRLQHNQASIQDRNGLLYQSVQSTAYIGLLNAVAIFPTLREVYYRECREGLYGAPVFLLSYFVHILPFHVVSTFLFSTWIYWGLGMYPDPARYGIYYSVTLMMHYAGEILGIAFMGIFYNYSIANSVTALILAIAGMISSGFLRSSQNMLEVMKNLGYINIFKYSSEALVANEFHGLNFTCYGNKTAEHRCLFQTGDQYINVFYPGAIENLPRNMGIVSSFVAGFAILAVLLFKIRGIHNLH